MAGDALPAVEELDGVGRASCEEFSDHRSTRKVSAIGEKGALGSVFSSLTIIDLVSLKPLIQSRLMPPGKSAAAEKVAPEMRLASPIFSMNTPSPSICLDEESE